MRALAFWTVVLAVARVTAGGAWSPDPKDVLNVKLGLVVPQLELAVKPLKGVTAKEVKYKPNTPGRLFVSLGYRNLGIGASTQPVSTPEDKQNLGETKSSDYQFRLYGRRITQEYFYQTYQGYHIDNSADVDPTYTTALKLQRPDLKSVNYGFNLIYTLSPADYSMGAAFDQSGRQKKSDGSALVALSARYQEMSGDTPIIPTQFQAVYDPDSNITKAAFSILATGLGYGHTFAFRDFYFAGQVLVGWTLEQRKYTYADLRSSGESRTGVTSMLKIGVGYNGESNYGGLQILSDGASYGFEKAELGATATVFSLFYGHRFDGVNLGILNPISDMFD